MAYLDLELDLPRSALDRVSPRHDPVSRLTMLERQVIQLASADGRWSLSGPGRFQSILAWLFGLERPNPLADPRLEALRRYAVTVRLNGARSTRDDDHRLAMIGFSIVAIAEIRGLVLGSRSEVG